MCEYTLFLLSKHLKHKEKTKETYIFYNLRHENMIDASILQTGHTGEGVWLCVTVCDCGLLLLLRLAELEKQDFNWRDKVPMLDPPLGCFFFFRKTCAALLSVGTTTKGSKQTPSSGQRRHRDRKRNLTPLRKQQWE